jgi:hypothetical protein
MNAIGIDDGVCAFLQGQAIPYVEDPIVQREEDVHELPGRSSFAAAGLGERSGAWTSLLVYRKGIEHQGNLGATPEQRVGNLMDPRDTTEPHVDRVLAPTKGQLAARGHVLLTTRNGPLDLLAAIEQGQDYEQLLTHSETIPYRGYRLLVFRLQKRVELKRASRDPRDRQRLPVLEETLRQIKGT